jgi:hypothetical protein
MANFPKNKIPINKFGIQRATRNISTRNVGIHYNKIVIPQVYGSYSVESEGRSEKRKMDRS